jgi:hypothetical protein
LAQKASPQQSPLVEQSKIGGVQFVGTNSCGKLVGLGTGAKVGFAGRGAEEQNRAPLKLAQKASPQQSSSVEQSERGGLQFVGGNSSGGLVETSEGLNAQYPTSVSLRRKHATNPQQSK